MSVERNMSAVMAIAMSEKASLLPCRMHKQTSAATVATRHTLNSPATSGTTPRINPVGSKNGISRAANRRTYRQSVPNEFRLRGTVLRRRPSLSECAIKAIAMANAPSLALILPCLLMILKCTTPIPDHLDRQARHVEQITRHR